MDDQTSCPICGKIAERGALYGSDKSRFRWINGEPNWQKNLSSALLGEGQVIGGVESFSGTIARGIRCTSCHRIILDYEPEP